MAGGPSPRVARADDLADLDALMKASTHALFPAYYDEVQVAACVEFVAVVDPLLVADGTYFAIEEDGELVACGGWSRRDKLFAGEAGHDTDERLLDPTTEPARVRAMFVRGDRTRRGLGTKILEEAEAAAVAEGFRTIALMSTLPGRALYERYGFQLDAESVITMPNGVIVGGAAMHLSVPRATSTRPAAVGDRA